MGAKFSKGRWEDATPTFVIYDIAADQPEAFSIDPKTKTVNRLAAD